MRCFDPLHSRRPLAAKESQSASHQYQNPLESDVSENQKRWCQVPSDGCDGTGWVEEDAWVAPGWVRDREVAEKAVMGTACDYPEFGSVDSCRPVEECNDYTYNHLLN